MQPSSTADRQTVAEIAERHGFSAEAVLAMLDAIAAGGGGMTQFNHSEFGGSGQWMRGGMTMVGDMFNGTLKARVIALCEALAPLAKREPGPTGGSFQSQHQGSFGQGPAWVARDDGWWPSGLGQPASTGAQNEMSYAYFPATDRLAVDRGGSVTVYDTRGHRIGGAAQQQAATGSMTFTSEHGPIDLSSLPVVSGEGSSLPRPGRPQSAAASGGDVFTALEKLAELRGKGVLTEEDFAAKKAELLRRV